MISRIYVLLIAFSATAPRSGTWAAFKDFIIENENDLVRFDNSNGEMMYDELLDDDESQNAIASSCNNYEDFNSHEDHNNIFDLLDLEMKTNILKNVLQQLVKDPRFQHGVHEDNLLGEHVEDFTALDSMQCCDNNQQCI